MAETPGPFDVELCSGRYFNVLRPDHRSLALDDIATPLGKTCRYGGACRGFFSVAEHAVLVARKLERIGAHPRLVMAGLHHDDAEFCLGDIQRPVKEAHRKLLADDEARDPDKHLTMLIDRAVWRAFAWPDKDRAPLWQTADLHDPLVKAVDVWACRFEASQIMPSRGENWQNVWLAPGDEPIETDARDYIGCQAWETARSRYLATHNALVAEARNAVAA